MTPTLANQSDGHERLRAHLHARYGIEVSGMTELDVGVVRVERRDGPTWVARIFPASRPVERVEGDAEILRRLADEAFPAERCADGDPISVLDGRQVLVTEHVAGVSRDRRAEVIRELGGYRALGELLARLETLPGEPGSLSRDGGAWHHLTDGGPQDEIEAAKDLLARAEERVGPRERPGYEALADLLEELDGGAGLPTAFLHPDFVLANVVASPEHGLVLVDWAGAGRGPRLWSLAFLLYSSGARSLGRADAVVSGYRRRAALEPEEVQRLRPVMLARPVILETWKFCAGRQTLSRTRQAADEISDLVDAVAERVERAFGSRR